jgi:hypothetical protein
LQEELIAEMKLRVKSAISAEMKGPIDYIAIYDDYKYLYNGEVSC